MPGQFTAADDRRRIEAGLVYIDDGLSNGPATHVLVAGVAAYQSKDFPDLLTTAAISARNFADWFVQGPVPGFRNEDCGLGSLALLLSETHGDHLAQYADGPVPRARAAEMKRALGSWLERVNSSPANIGIVYVASHGFSDFGKTALLLEDYGQDKDDATHGMAEIEQLVGALENAVPDNLLLLFDCCRSVADGGFQPGETRGKLISLRARVRDVPPNIWAICSTALGRNSYGQEEGPTLFSMALMDALNGVASETTMEGRPVRAGLLPERLDQLLRLHRLPREQLQVPSGRGTGSFSLTYPVITDTVPVPVYVSLRDAERWPHVEISLSDEKGGSSLKIVGQGGASPFAKCMMPDRAHIRARAMRNGDLIGEVARDVMPPALFLEIGAAPAGRAPAPRQTTKSAATRSALELELWGLAGFKAVAEITALDDTRTVHQTVVLSAGKKIEAPPLSPGRYGIRVQTSDGRMQTSSIALGEGEVVTASFAMQGSQDDWNFWSSAPDTGRDTSGQPEADAQTVGFVGLDLSIQENVSGAALTRGAVIGSHERWDVADMLERRFTSGEAERGRPIFARVSCGERREFAVLPSLGQGGEKVRGTWLPHLIVDRGAPADRRMTTVAIDTAKWASLLGFLACRDFASGSILLKEERADHSAMVALGEPTPNPLPALAGALIAVAAAREVETWVPLVHQIMKTYPGVPDAPIILARHKLMFGGSADGVSEARSRLLAACELGIPFFSLSVEWLARGLGSLIEDEDEARHWRDAARRLAARVDPTTALTIVRER